MVELAKTLVRKTRTLSDRIYTWLEMNEQRASIIAPMTFTERLFYLRLRHFLHGKDLVVYDVGASTGDFTMMASKVRSVAQVYAFEPIPEIYSRLVQRTQKSPKVRCFGVALGGSPGTAQFYQNDFTPSSSLLPMGELHQIEFPFTTQVIKRTIEVVCLDDWSRSNQLPLPDLVKVDVQGFEDRVLRGGAQTIRHARCCMLEMSFDALYEGSLLFDDLYRIMRDWGFRLVGLTEPLMGKSGRLLQVDGIFEQEVGK
jgi:FkbM family methyltransferase